MCLDPHFHEASVVVHDPRVNTNDDFPLIQTAARDEDRVRILVARLGQHTVHVLPETVDDALSQMIGT